VSGRGLCDGPITQPEESYRLWCVITCDLEPLRKKKTVAAEKVDNWRRKRTRMRRRRRTRRRTRRRRRRRMRGRRSRRTRRRRSRRTRRRMRTRRRGRRGCFHAEAQTDI
jgi:hypothetical protein